MGSPELHGYHCDCGSCDAYGYPLHAQRDSSCNGEFISRVMQYDRSDEYDDDRGPLDIMAELEAAAVEVDAEPGPNAGCHVHVGIDHLFHITEYGDRSSTPLAHDAFWAFLRWERVLANLAAGRFMEQRDSNYEVLRHVLNRLDRNYGECFGSTPSALARWDEYEDLPAVRENAYLIHRSADRHSNLNIRTHHPTWEYRLWNSTRAAWRMELWTRLSIALVDPAVVQVLNDAELVRRVTHGSFERLASYLDNCGHSRAAELVERQSLYARDIAPTAPSSLTAVV